MIIEPGLHFIIECSGIAPIEVEMIEMIVVPVTTQQFVPTMPVKQHMNAIGCDLPANQVKVIPGNRAYRLVMECKHLVQRFEKPARVGRYVFMPESDFFPEDFDEFTFVIRLYPFSGNS